MAIKKIDASMLQKAFIAGAYNLEKNKDYINEPFPNGESLQDVEKRIKDLIIYIKENYRGKTIGIVAHRAPQLALEVLTNKLTWEEAISNDWRNTGDWQPGWEYIIKD